MFTTRLATFPVPDMGPLLMTVVPFNQVAVPVPVDELPVNVTLVLVQVKTPFVVAAILTVGAWLFCVIVVAAVAVQPLAPVTVTV